MKITESSDKPRIDLVALSKMLGDVPTGSDDSRQVPNGDSG